MPFIKLHPLKEIGTDNAGQFGKGQPAHCQAPHRHDTPELYLNVNQIAAFEECPLYLIAEAEPNALVDGIRIRLVSGDFIVAPDDPENEGLGFLAALQRAAHGEIVELGYSRYLRELEQKKPI